MSKTFYDANISSFDLSQPLVYYDELDGFVHYLNEGETKILKITKAINPIFIITHAKN